MTMQRLSKRVEIKIKQLIDEGHLKIGDRLPPERELAEAMNVSRHTLREAIKSLEMTGLLKSRPGSGTFIFNNEAEFEEGLRPILAAMPKMTEIFQFRWALEPAIVVAAVSNATTDDLKLVKENLERQREALELNDTALWAAADLDFHLLLPRLSGNSLFISVMDSIAHYISICVDTAHLNPARMKLYYDGHKGVYLGIAKRDTKRAVLFMEEHLQLLPWQENLRVSSAIHD